MPRRGGLKKHIKRKKVARNTFFSLTNIVSIQTPFKKAFRTKIRKAFLRLFQLIFHAAFSAPDSPVSEISHITGSPFTQCQNIPLCSGSLSLKK